MKPQMMIYTALLLLPGLAARSGDVPRHEKVAWGKTIHGVQAGLVLEGGEFSHIQGQRVTFKLLLRNVNTKPVTFGAEGYVETPFNWSALTQENKHKIFVARLLNVNGIFPQPFTLTLAPGETRVLVGPPPNFLLARMGSSAYTEPTAIIHSGIYTIQVAPFLPGIEGRDNWTQNLVTGIISLKVAELPI